MEKLGVNAIREKFLAFFEGKNHLRMKSHSLIPENDNSLLLINSGMAPLKPFFTGEVTPPNLRVTTCQKCIRTGDIENVGLTARHGTFFEMLGNFSFGDYFKEEIIPWSWEFCTEVLEIPADKMYISIYLEDDEAFEIWNKKVGIPADKIVRMGKADNFWEHGLGPCGPCSELYFDRGEEYGCGSADCKVGCDCDRYMEFWNLVFTQFDKQEDGSYPRLDNPNIDTGMGLERMAAIMQGVQSIFDVDTVKAVRDKACELAKISYGADAKKDVSVRVITDHARALTFLTGDGVLPSNEGRGYVLRRLLRRAARHGKLLGLSEPFLAEACKVVIDFSGEAYPELTEKRDYILKVVSHEEERFNETLSQGLEMLKTSISRLKQDGISVLDGQTSFRLYDTFGFPPDLTKEILEEHQIAFDDEAFNAELAAQKERTRNAREESNFSGREQTVYEKIDKALETEFVGYDCLNVDSARVLAITCGNNVVDSAKVGDEASIFVDKTPFYAESGGQTGDAGVVTDGKGLKIEITDCVKTIAGKIAHIGVVKEGEVTVGQSVSLAVDEKRRAATTRNHTATHLLQKALREVLGTHVEQAGSYVSPERLRFDFTHFSPMTAEEREKVEQIVTEKIYEAISVNIMSMPIDEARKMGAMALFGEKYDDVVRVIKVGGFSTELCGGCHVASTANIGAFKILSETGIAAGVRRIEALTGLNVMEYYKNLDGLLFNVAKRLKTTPENVLNRVSSVVDEAKDFKRQIESLRSKMAGNIVDDMIADKKEINGISVVSGVQTEMDANSLREMGDRLKDKLGSGVVVLVGTKDGNANIVVMSTDDVVKKGMHAGKVVSEIAPLIGGKGGGRPNMAQAGGKNVEGARAALDKAAELIAELCKPS